MAAQLLGDRLHLPGRDALHVHLGQARHQRLLGALVALEQLGREAAVAILRHAQLELADPGDQGARVVAGAVAEPGGAALALRGAERVGHLGFQHLLQHGAHDLLEKVRIGEQRRFRQRDGIGRLRLGHGRTSWLRGDVEHRHLAMAARRGDSELSGHSPRRIWLKRATRPVHARRVEPAPLPAVVSSPGEETPAMTAFFEKPILNSPYVEPRDALGARRRRPPDRPDRPAPAQGRAGLADPEAEAPERQGPAGELRARHRPRALDGGAGIQPNPDHQRPAPGDRTLAGAAEPRAVAGDAGHRDAAAALARAPGRRDAAGPPVLLPGRGGRDRDLARRGRAEGRRPRPALPRLADVRPTPAPTRTSSASR